ncbi:hypothetical protein HY732_00135 [Candidatus Uhrbacteria bacterium]|nr:hypothetical protein [Candidatus Uhrbacteria bacterium]
MKKLSFPTIVCCALLFGDLVLILAHSTLRQSLGFFDLDKEGSLKAVFSGFQLIASGVASGWIAFLSSRLRAPRLFVWLWSTMSALFIYLALDDMMMIHERIGFVLNNWTGLHGAYESFNWLIYFTPLMIAGLLAFVAAVRALLRIDARTRFWAIFGFAGFVLTLLFEVVGGYLLQVGNTPLYQLSIIFEESFLLFGETFFLSALVLAVQSLFSRCFVMRATEDIPAPARDTIAHP